MRRVLLYSTFSLSTVLSPKTSIRGSHAKVASSACVSCDGIGLFSWINGGRGAVRRRRVRGRECRRARRRHGRRGRGRDGGREGRRGRGGKGWHERGRHGWHDRGRHERRNGRNVGRHEWVWWHAEQQFRQYLWGSGFERRRRAACAILSLRHALRPLLAGLL